MNTSTTIPCKRFTTFLCTLVIALGLLTSQAHAQSFQLVPQNMSGCNCSNFSVCITSQVNDGCNGGDNGSATASASGGNTPYSYVWNTNPVQKTATATGLAAGTYTVTATDGMSCTATACVIITQGNKITLSIPSCAAICKGSCTTLTVSGTSCATYTWSPSTALSATTGSSVSACPTVTTTYTVTGTENGCTGTATVVVTVNPATTITIPTPSAICLGSCATLTISGSPCASYTWSPSTGLSATTGSSVSACPTVTTTYTVTGPDKNGCAAKGTVVVTVNPATTITISTPSAICKGSCATLTISGSPCASYTWSPSTGLSATTGSSVSACPTVTTTYTVTGPDKNGCAAKGTVVVTVNPTTTITIPTPSPICKGSCATLTVSGAPCESYTWSPSTGLSATTGSSVSACPTVTTTYTVSGSDHNGCPATGTVVVTVNPTTTITVPPATICSGSCTTLTVNGAPCESYSWSPSAGLSVTTGSSISACPTVTTTYTVTGSDNNGCPASGTVVVTVNPKPTISASSATICRGNSATLSASGATSYTWSPATGLSATTGSSVTANPTVTTTYTITGTNGSDCSNTTTSVVIVNPLPTISANSATICYGNSATLSASGATSYTWSPATGLSATTGSSVTANPTTTTTYTITGTNSNSCSNTTTSVVTVNPLPTVSVTAKLPAVCSGNPDTLIASGATSYTWSPATGLSATTGSMVIANPTINTTYTVTGTNGNGCVGTNTISVVISPAPVLKITVNPSEVCSGSPDTLVASGGVSYIWSPAVGLSATSGSEVIATPTASTTYTVFGTGDNGCADINATIVPLTVNPKPNISVPGASICYGNSTTLTASGASTYTWSPATGLSATTGAIVTANPTITTTYTIIGTNSTGCTDTTKAVVTVYPLLVISVPAASTCIGNCATLTASGATTYTWTPGTALSATTGSIVNACPTATTTYIVTGTNGNGCTGTTTVVVTVNPLPVVTITAKTPSICIGGSDTLKASGAVSYTWSPATGLSATTGAVVIASPTVTTKYKVTGVNANGCVCNDSITITVNPLPVISVPPAAICYGTSTVLTASGAVSYTWYPGTGLSATTGSIVTAYPTVTTTYTVTGTNGSGCTNTTTTIVTVYPLPTISANSATICIGNSTTLTASGATSYTWSPAAGLSASTGAIVTATPTTTTTYTITGTNGNGCSNTTTSIVTVNPLPTISANSAAICIGNSATLTASGASSYTWSPAAGLSATTGAIVTATPTATTTYTITGTNGSGCTNTTTSVVTVNPLPTISANSAAICIGNSATLTASGATSYTWSPAAGLSATTGAVVTATPTATTTYTITGTNGNGCSNTTTSVVTVNPLPTISANSAAICIGNSATLTASGASSYTWSPAAGLSATTGAVVTATPTATTTYTITGTNGNGCSNTTTSVVTVNPLPTISANSAAICIGNSATLTASGATSYTWSPAAGLSATTGAVVTATPTATTTYTITGTNGNGCSNTTTSVVTVNPLPVISVPGATVCYGNSATLTASGASSYTWSPAVGLSATTGAIVTATPTATTTYTIIGTNANSCTSTTTTVVNVNSLPQVSVPGATVCYGNSATLTASGAASYTWSPAAGLSATTGAIVTATPTATTTYTIIGTAGTNCVSTTTAVVTVNPLPTISANSATICIGNSATLTASGATSYTWSPAAGLSATTGTVVTAYPTATTTYTITGINGNGCSNTTISVVTVNPLPIISVPSASVCYGNSTALTASGATSYTWSPATGLSATTGAIVTANPTVTTTYTITGTNSNGCVATTTTVVTVTNTTQITLQLKNDMVCAGANVTFTVGAVGSDLTYTWQWNWATLPGHTSDTLNIPSVSLADSGIYSVIVSGACGTDTSTATLKINSKPVITIQPKTNIMCAVGGECDGHTFCVTATGVNLSYQWYFKGNPVPGATERCYSFSPGTYADTGAWFVVVSNQCGSDTSDSAIFILVNSPVVTVDSPSICYGTCATLTVTGTNAIYYSWSPSTALSATTGSSVTACPTVTTTYTVTVTGPNGCTGTAVSVVTVNTPPTISVPPASICYGNSAALTASGATSYTWSPATGLSATTGAIVTATPTVTTTYTITGTNANNCTSTTTTVVTVNPLPTISVPPATICYGNSTALTASGANTYTWSPALGLSATTGAIVTANPTVTTTYTVTGTNSNYCTNTTTVVVTVNPLPTISVPPVTICYGNSAALTASGATSYTWSPSTDLSATTGAIVTANPTVTTTYTVTGTNSNYCTNTTTVVVTVNSLPTVSVPPATICYGNSTALTASGATSYTWSPATGLSATTGAIVAANPTVTTTYTVDGTSGSNCSATTTVVVTVNPLPTISVPPAAICYGNSAALTASGATSYIWSPATGLSTTTGAIVTANPTVTTTYTVNGTNGNSCVGTTTVVVTVNPLPTVSVTAELPAVCSGNPDTLIASGANSYTWSPATGLSVTSGSMVIASPTINTTYTVTGTNGNGCVNSDTISVVISPAPVVKIFVNPSEVCAGNPDTLLASGATTYMWSPSTGLSATSGSEVIATPTVSTTYDVFGVSNVGCESLNVTIVPLTVNPKPTIAVPGASICYGNSTTLTASGATSYTWSPANSLSATTGAIVTATPTATITYTIIGTNSTGCTDTTTAIVTVNPLPIISVPSATICYGNSTALTASGATSYTWSPATGLSATTGAIVTANPTVTTTYTITGTNSNGCVATTTTVVTVTNTTQITLQLKNDTVCAGANVTFTVGAVGSDLTYTWQWNWATLPGHTSDTLNIPSVSLADSGIYSVIVSGACGTDTSTATLKINSKPVITIQPKTNIMCAVGGECDGHTFCVTATGVNLSYQWYFKGNPVPGATERCYSFSPGTYADTGAWFVVVSNQCGSDTSDSAIFILVNSPVVTVDSPSICYGTCATLTVTGTNAIYYSWSPSTALSATTGSSVTACPTVTTTYTVTVTGPNGCTGTAVSVVTVNTPPTISVPPASVCYGNCTTLTASGLGENGTYTWSSAQSEGTSTGVEVQVCPTATTTYTVIGTNGNGCSDTVTTVVTVNPLPTISVPPATICYGNSTALTASGANTYTWSPATGLSATTGAIVTVNPTVTTTYTVNGTNGNSCVGTTTVVVTVNPLPTISVPPATICYGNSAALTASGANTYTWSPATGLSATTGAIVTANPTVTTTYTVTGTNSNYCTNTTTVIVTVNPLPTVSVPPAAICYGNSTVLTASGASSYTWSPANGLSATTGAIVTANPTVTTTYTVDGTSGSNCSATTTVVVTVNPLPTISVPPAAICYGNSTVLTASGATSYTWSPATGLSATTGSIVTANPTVTTTYTVNGTNGNSCVGTTTVVVTVNPLPTVSVPPATICDGNSTELTASGAISYTWSPANGLNATTGAIVTATPTVTTTYTVTGTNSNYCTNTTTVIVTVNPLPTVSVSPAAICYGNSAALTASGASSYTWSPANGLSATTGAIVIANPTVTTTYTVDGTSGSNCSATTTVVVTVNPLPTISVPPAAICYGNSTVLTASGATSYTWSPATGLSATTGSIVTANPTVTTTYTVDGINGNSCSGTTTVVVTVNPLPIISVPAASVCINNCATLTASGAVSYTWSPATALSATTGSIVNACPTITTTYTVTGTNESGCVGTTTVVVTVNPLPVIALTATTPSICIGGSDTITASGATLYTWSPATGLNVTTGAVVIANPTVTTTYTVIGTNGNGCVCNDTIVIIVNPLPVISVPPAAICYGNSTVLTASGASSYTWYPATGLSATTGATVTANPTATTTYTITGTNGSGCSGTTTTVVTVNPLPTISVPSSTICYGNSTVLTASGATSYTWSPATGLSATTGAIVTANPTVTTTYTVNGTNGNSCVGTTTVVVTVNPLPTISVPPATVCSGNSAVLTASGASSYTWSPATGLSATTGAIVTANPTVTTTYTVNGTNGNGCIGTTTVVVTVDTLPSIILTETSPSICVGGVDTLRASGATNYIWNPEVHEYEGLPYVTVDPTVTTTYTVTGTNGNGCVDSSKIVVVVNPLPMVSVPPATICYGNSAVLTASGAATYTWTPGTGLNETIGAVVTANPTTTTTYTVIGTNESGCADTTTTVVTVNPLPTISVPPATICYGNSTALTASGVASYTWSPATGLSATTGAIVTANPTATTTYTVNGTNGNSCVGTTTVVVTVNPLPTISVPSATICYGNSTALTASGATSYTWSPATGLSATTGAIVTANPTVTTTYTVDGTNGNNCSGTTTVIVSVNPLPTISVPAASICDGNSTALTASGATSYTWSPATGLSATIGAIVTANPTVTTTYTVNGTNGNSCVGTTTVVVTVDSLPTVSVPPAAICYGSSAILTVSGASASTQIVLPDSNAVYDLLSSYQPTTNYEGFYEFDAWHWTVNSNTAIGRSIVRYNLSHIPAGSTITNASLSLYGDSASDEDNGGSYSSTSDASYLQLLTSSWNPSTVDWNNQPDTTTTDEVALAKSTSAWEDYLNINVTALISDLYNNPSTYTGIMLRLQDENPVYNGIIFGSNTNSNPRFHPKLIITYTSGTGNNSSDTYTWTPSTGLSATTGSSVTANPTVTTTYTVVATNGNGCTNSTTVVVTVNPLPTVAVPPATICDGNSAALTASGATSYTWSPATGLSATTGSIVTANPTVTTTYTVDGINGNSCSGTTTVVVTVNPLPIISVPAASVCINNCATLTASGAVSYTWSPATALSATTGSIVNACPTITTTYTVTGTNESGCVGTTTVVVTVNPLPVIALTATTPSICIGGSDTITASGATLYTWSPATGLNVTTGAVVIANPTVTTTYTVIGTNGNGCVCNDTIVIIVNPLPVISVPPAAICYGNSTVLTASGASSYTWYPATGLSATTGATVTANPTATTTYTITGTNGSGCSGTTTTVVTVNPLPTISVPSSTICYGNSTVLTASGATSYTWSPATGLSATTGAIVTANPTVTTTYTVNGTNGNSCVGTTTVVVTVNPLPTISVPPATVCSGNSAVLTASGASSYTWSPATGLSATTGAIVTANPTVTTTYTVNGTNGNGCIGTTTVVVTVDTLPSIKVTESSPSICTGSNDTLRATGANGYTWTPQVNVKEGLPYVIVNPTVTTTYTVVGTNGNGCVDSATIVVIVNPLPTVSVPLAAICVGNSTELTASGATSYTWTPGTGLSATTGAIVTTNPTATTTYTVVGTNESGCADTTTTIVTVNPIPTITVATPSPICNGNGVLLTASGAGEGGNYSWSPMTGLNQTAGSSVTASPTVTTTYTIIGTSGSGCSNTTTVVVTVLPTTTITQLNNDTVCAGASASFTVSATGNDLTYTWQHNGVTLSSRISDTLDITTTTLADSGVYSVIVSGTCGTDTSTAKLKVNSAPAGITLDVNDSTINSGQNYNLSLCANAGQPLYITLNVNGTNLTFQWQKDGVNINGASEDTFTIQNVTISDTGSYSVIVDGPCGADTSALIDLLINNNPIVVNVTVNDQVVTSKLDTITECAGNEASFSVTATGSNLTYQWQKNGVNINGATSSTYTIDSTVHSDGGLYDVIVTGTCGSDTVYAPLKVRIKPIITSPPSDVTMCVANGNLQAVSFCVQAKGYHLTYQWYHDGRSILGATDSCYILNPATFADTGGYHVVVSNECGSDTSRRVTLKLYGAPVIISQPVCATACVGSSTTFCVTASGSNLTYQWQFNHNNINGANSSCYTIPSVALCNAGCYDVVVSNSCNSITSYVVTLTVNTPPVITCQPKGESLCSVEGRCGGSEGVTFCVTATGSNLSYQWQYNGNKINGANSPCYTINPVYESNAGNYDVIVSNSCGSDTSNIAVLNIGSSPVITSQPVCASVCLGNRATFCVTAEGINLTYQWQFNGKNIWGATSSCYTISSAALCNAGCYDVVVSNSCGCVTSHVATLTISAPPAITCQPQGQSLCAMNGMCGDKDGVTFCVTATGNNLWYQWQYNGKNINGANSSCYTINPVSTSNAGCYDVIVSNSCGSVTSNTATLTIGSSPVITSQPVCATVCSGSSATFCVTATGTNLTYQWQFNGKNIHGATSCCYTISSAASCNAGCYDVVVSNSCGSTTSYTATLAVNNAPAITCQPVCETVCAGSGTTFSVTASGSNLTYQWKFNDENIHGATSSYYTIASANSSNAGYYEVVISNSCSCITSNYVTLTVNNCETCSVPTDLKSSDITCNGATLSWSYESSASSFTVEYKAVGCSTWSTTTVRTNSVTLSCLSSGVSYDWSVSENCSCGSSSEYASVVEFCTSSNCCNGNNMAPRGDGNSGDGHTITGVTAYPNPTFSLTTLAAKFDKQSDVTVVVTDLTGRILMSETETAPAGDYIHQFDMSKQQAGTYFLIIRSGDQMVTSKVVKIE